MATYTTNYNLEKPDESDNFGDFRASYNSNMDIIDQNLGGGGGGGGGGGELYLDNGLIGSDSGVYVTCNLDKPLVNGFYLIRVYDSSNGAVGWYHMKWEGNTQTLSIADTVGQGRLVITSTTAGLTYYSGAWRNIYCDILSIGSSGGSSVAWNQIQTTGVKIAEITINGVQTDVYAPSGGNSRSMSGGFMINQYRGLIGLGGEHTPYT